MPRDAAQERDAMHRLRALLAARPNAALVAVIVDTTWPGSKPLVQFVMAGDDPSILDAAADELRMESRRTLERQELQRRPPPRLPYRDD